MAEPAGSAHLLRCSIPVERVFGVVSRRLPGQAAPQTLVACGSVGLCPLLGANARGPLQLGPPLQLYAEPAAGSGGAGGAAAAATARQPYAWGRASAFARAWDPWSASIYMVHVTSKAAILRLSADDTVTLVAGSVEETGEADGAGGAARFSLCSFIATDGRGRLFVADRSRIRQLQLPAAWEAGGAAMPAAAGGAAAAGGEVVVTTLPLEAPRSIWGLAFEGGNSDGSGSLVYATPTTVYRLPLGGEGAAAPALLAGQEGLAGTADGHGSSARFDSVIGLALDGEGCAYVADWHGGGGPTAVRRVALDGSVTTIGGSGFEGLCHRPAILPNGCLALYSHTHLHVLDLGLRLPPGHAGVPLPPPPQPPGPPPRTLAGDWGAMLDRQPDGSSDLTVTAGGCPFHVHKAVLRSRSDYYDRCLGGSFAEGASTEQQQALLNLPDVDPEVFKLALRFMYTGAVDVPPALARAVAELADRLLLPELCAAAQAVVEASVTASSVVGALLWAEAAGPSFLALLDRLKGWYAEHLDEVLEEAEESVELLAARSPSLMLQVMKACARAAKRRRTH